MDLETLAEREDCLRSRPRLQPSSDLWRALTSLPVVVALLIWPCAEAIARLNAWPTVLGWSNPLCGALGYFTWIHGRFTDLLAATTAALLATAGIMHLRSWRLKVAWLIGVLPVTGLIDLAACVIIGRFCSLVGWTCWLTD
jgi:hypothetical protein